jgi:hypothetical protein
MIITEKFVYIHWPKTGGTFVTQVLDELISVHGHRRSWGQRLGLGVRSRIVPKLSRWFTMRLDLRGGASPPDPAINVIAR